jgi:hypothetical protein
VFILIANYIIIIYRCTITSSGTSSQSSLKPTGNRWLARQRRKCTTSCWKTSIRVKIISYHSNKFQDVDFRHSHFVNARLQSRHFHNKMAELLVNCTCPPKKEGNSKGPLAFALKIAFFFIHFSIRGDTSETFEISYWGLFGMQNSILGSKKPINIVKDLLHNKLPCGIIRTNI